MKAKTLKLRPDFLAQCRKIAPLGIDFPLIDTMIADIQGREIRSDADEAKRLRTLIEQNLVLIKPERSALLQETAIYVLPYKRCISFTQPDENGEGEIVISEGMIDLVAASIHDGALQYLIPPALQDIPMGGTGQPLLTMLNMATALKRYRFYRHGEAIPNFACLLTTDLSQQADISLRGALTFMLLHELGHIQLNHLKTDEPRLSHYDMAYEQRLSAYQFQEIEADEYALDSMIVQARDIGSYWMSQALAFFVSLELLSGVEGTHHPLAINRQHAAERRRELAPQLAPNPPVAAELASYFQEMVLNRTQTRKPSILDAPLEEIDLALQEIIRVLTENNVDFSRLVGGSGN